MIPVKAGIFVLTIFGRLKSVHLFGLLNPNVIHYFYIYG